jgi:hypothetical protein
VQAIDFHLHAAGVLAPGIASFGQFCSIASGTAPYVPSPLVLAAPSTLPAQERRRSSQAVRLVLSCVEEALKAGAVPPESLRSVFASDEGTGEVCQQMLQALATTRQVSPLVFSNSVLNAPSGYFSIAWRNREPATVVSMGAESFASGLLCAVTESLTCEVPVLLVSYDPAMAAPLDEMIPIADPVASAWIISAAPASAPVLASFRLALRRADVAAASALPAWMPATWAPTSSARSLAALALVDALQGSRFELSLGAQMLELARTGAPA